MGDEGHLGETVERIDLIEMIKALIDREAVGAQNWENNGDRLISALPEFEEQDLRTLTDAVVLLFHARQETYSTPHAAALDIFLLGIEFGREVERRV